MLKKIIIAVLVVCGLWAVGNVEHYYTRKDCRVIDVTENWVKFEDYGKEVWAIENDGKFKIGDRADLKMYDNLTSPYIYDDEIVKVIKK